MTKILRQRRIRGGYIFAAVALLLGTIVLGQAKPSLAQEPREVRNEQIVRAFYEAGLNRKDFKAASTYLGPKYIQHNPMATDGAEGFAKFVAYLRQNHPQARSEIRRAFADGDFVVLHVFEKLEPTDRGNAIVDIFRLERGKIVEHWDVKQAIPATSANNNSMF